MTETSLHSLLADVLRATAEAHHQAFLATDGEDPEWPIWYAEHLQPAVSDVLERDDLTRAEIVYLLVAASRDVDPDEPWAEAYAQFMLEQLMRR